MTSYLLDPHFVFSLNRRLLHETESHGYREGGSFLLKSALARPLQTWAGQPFYCTPEARAGALIHSLAVNHPFLAANKRTAVTATGLYLDSQALSWSLNRREVVMQLDHFVGHGFAVEESVDWVEKSVRRI